MQSGKWPDPKAAIVTALVVVGGLVGIAGQRPAPSTPTASNDAGVAADAVAPELPTEDSGQPKPYDRRPVIRTAPPDRDEPSGSVGQCWVNGHYRRGTWVSGYFRRCR